MNFVKKICAWIGNLLIRRSLRGTGRTAPESDISAITIGAWDSHNKTCSIAKQP